MSFERHTRRKLKNYQSELDTDALWGSIQNDIPKEKEKKRRGIFFLFFGFAVMGGIIALYYNPTVKNKIASYIIPNQIQDNHTALLPEDTYYENHMSFFADAAAGNVILNKGNTNPSLFNNTQTFNTQQRIKREVLNYQAIPQSTPSINSNNKLPLIKESISVDKIDLDDKTIINLIPIPFMTGWVEFQKEKEKLLAIVDENSEEEESDKKIDSKKVKIAFGVTGSYAKSMAEINSKSPINYFYAKKREVSEKAVSTISISGDVVFSFKKNIQFRTGLAYTRITERFSYWEYSGVKNNAKSNNYNPSFGDQDVINNNFTNASNKPANYASSAHSSASSPIDLSIFSALNKHHIIDIPVIIGYEFGTKKVTLLAEAGAYFNLNTTSKGFIATPEGSYAKIDDQENNFKRNILLTTYTGFSTKFNFSDQNFLKIGAHYQYVPFSITNEESILQQKYHSVGVHIGIFHTLK